MLRQLASRVRALFSRTRRESDLDDELAFHLDAEAEERRQTGASAADARRAARLDFGNVAAIAEDARAAWTWTWFEQLAQDVRYAGRTLTRSRAFAATAVLSLALGIGANTLLYSLADAILIRTLPVSAPEALVRMTWRAPKSEWHGTSRHDSNYEDPATGFTAGVFSFPAFELFQKRDDIFASVFAYQSTGPISVSVHDDAEPAQGEYVSGGDFRALGLAPAAGRWLGEDDDRPDAPLVAVLSQAVADSRFGGAHEAVGQKLLINNLPGTVVGVAPRGFSGTDPGVSPDAYLPLHARLVLQRRFAGDDPPALFIDPSEAWLEVMGRLRPGVSLERAQAMLAPPFQQLTESVRATSHRWRQAPTLVLVAGARGIDGLRRAYATPLTLLMGLAGLILLLACSNIGNLLLARSTARAREIAVRISLGAARGRIIRQLLTESLVLSTLGGVLGLGVAVLGTPAVTVLFMPDQPNGTFHADPNWRVLLFAFGLSMATGLLFGTLPAIRATRTALLPAIKDARTTPASASGRRAGISRVLVGLQIGATLVLLVAAGLFARTLANFARLDLGFNRDRLLTVTVNAAQAGFDDKAAIALYQDLRGRFAAIPGARAVGMSDLAIVGDGRSSETVVPVGREPKNEGCCDILNVGAGFFRALEIPLARGRDIDERDERLGARPVVVVSESFARAQFGDEDAIGRLVRIPNDAPTVAGLEFEIVGVARDVRYGQLLDERPTVVYIPFGFEVFGTLGEMVYEIRTAGEPSSYANAVRQVVHDTSARLPVARMTTQASLIDQTIATQVLLTRLCLAFAILALTIAVVGLYGTVAYDVSRRTQEIGVRMALGADRRRVVRMVLRDVLVLAVVGVVAGVPAALAASGFAEAYLFGVTSRDPVTIAAAVSVLLGAALLASYAPARAAARLNPTIALRGD